MFFSGYSEYRLDSKNRLTIPARYRRQLESNTLILSLAEVSEKPVIAVFPNYDILTQNIQKYTLCKNNIFYERNLALMTRDIKIDSAGRISLSQYVNKGERNMIICGRIELFEIWKKEDFIDYTNKQNLHIKL